jgi:ribonuclease VapC
MANREPGEDRVKPVTRQAFLSTVNLSEILQKLVAKGVPLGKAQDYVLEFIGPIIPFDPVHAALAAEMAAPTRQFGLSFADRACLALGRSLDALVLTADQKWLKLDLGVRVELIRGLPS